MRNYIIGILSVVSLLICACASETPPPAKPKFAGRVLLLSGDQTNGADLFELTAATNSANNVSLVTKGVFEAWANYDRTGLLLATKTGFCCATFKPEDVKSVSKDKVLPRVGAGWKAF